MREFKSFLKTVEGNEGNLCHYPTRLDTYGCGCSHDCSYCYAKSLLDFRGLWNPQEPAVADIKKIRAAVKKMHTGEIVRLGGMTDCFQPIEKQHRVTLETIKALNARGVEYLIVTKSAIVADPEYIAVYDKKLAHFQITVTTLDDERAATYEKASPPSERVRAILTLQEMGFDVAIRLSPLIEGYMDFERLNGLGIQKAIVEFLRVNTWVEKWFAVDLAKYGLKQSGYRHIRLNEKKRLISQISIPEVSICEDDIAHYKYWRLHQNPNKDDCCNLRRGKNEN